MAEKGIDAIENLSCFLRLVNLDTELRTVSNSVGEIRRELLHLSDGVRFAALDEQRIVMAHQFIALAIVRNAIRAGCKIFLDLREDPWVRRCGSTDHYRVAIRLLNHPNGIFGSKNVAIANHRDSNGSFC